MPISTVNGNLFLMNYINLRQVTYYPDSQISLLILLEISNDVYTTVALV